MPVVERSNMMEYPRSLPPFCFGILALPEGVGNGFITVTLAFVLSKQGFGVDVIATLIGLSALTGSIKFLITPILDLSLNARIWYLICLAGIVAGVIGITQCPLNADNTWLISAMVLMISLGGTLLRATIGLAVAQTCAVEDRGAIGGWFQAANLGGTGIGGGLGLWLFEHAGGLFASCAAMIAITCLAAVPIFLIRLPRITHADKISQRIGAIVPALVGFFKTREAILLGIVNVVPMGVGGSLFLLSAVADDWQASADLVALVTGLVAGLSSAAGSLLAGFLSRRIRVLTLYLSFAAASGFGQIAMAFMPHTPFWFATLTLVNMVILGGAWGCVAGICLQSMRGSGASTIYGTMSSLSNVPVYVGTILFGAVQARYGSTAMLAGEGALGLVTFALFLGLLVIWPEPKPLAQGTALAD